MFPEQVLLVSVAQSEFGTDLPSAALVPGRLYQQPACVGVADLGDRHLLAPLDDECSKGISSTTLMNPAVLKR